MMSRRRRSMYPQYYCTNCDANLSEQYGFDSDKGYWKCRNCGRMLLGNDVYSGDRFPNVLWFCDNCNAFLNVQFGFSDVYGEWTCTECQYDNQISAEAIDSESDGEYEEREETGEFECPNCGTYLDDQSGFSEYKNDWKCTECGAWLHRNSSFDDYAVMKHICPKCDEPLDIQSGYSEYEEDWTCTECGAHLHHDYSSQDYTIMEHICPKCDAPLDIQSGYSAYDDDWTCTECGTHLHHDYSSQDYTIMEHICPKCDAPLDIQSGYSEYDDDWTCTECGAKLHRGYLDDPYEVVTDDDEEDERYSRASYGSRDDSEEDDEDEADNGDEAEKERGHSYEEATVKNQYSGNYYDYSSGYSSARTSYQGTYETGRTYTEENRRYYTESKPKKKRKIWLAVLAVLLLAGMVRQIVNMDLFHSHEGEIRLTHSANAYKNEDYMTAIMMLEDQGLSDIHLTALNDLKNDLFSNAGKVKAVEIDATSDFAAGSWVSKDAAVTISYHSFAKEEKNGFSEETNAHVIMNRVDITLPSYWEEESTEAVQAVFRAADDNKTILLLEFDDNRKWSGIDQFDMYHVLEDEKAKRTDRNGRDVTAIGRKDGTIYTIRAAALDTGEGTGWLHVVLISEETCRIDYTSDFESILTGIYVPKETEVLLDFSPDEYKGENIEEVQAILEEKGFQNIQTENLHDIGFNIFTKAGEVEAVLINGVSDFSAGEWIDENTEIIITYHGKK